MEEIVVPGPPREAFNKHRRMSDLIKKQVEHFKHLEHKFSPQDRAKLPQHAISTEDEAARYIAAITRVLLSAKAPARPARAPIQMPRPASKSEGLALAASAEPKPAKKTAKSKSSTRKGKGRA
jgi:hypothetical protein